jgi:hypothetical protein
VNTRSHGEVQRSVSGANGINGAIQRASVQQQAAQSASLATGQTAVQQALVGLPGLARVPVPPRPDGDAFVKPKKSANSMVPPREQGGGSSPLSTASVADTAAGAQFVGEDPGAPVEERASRQGQAGSDQLPSSADLVAFTRTSRGDTVYLEAERWHNHIKTAHITDAPNARGKRTTTWWPVLYSATGQSSMSEGQVVSMIMDAASKGHLMNAPRGTLMSVYEVPQQEAAETGVSEVKVSLAPDGRILSAYPSLGSNVLAVRELTPEELAAQAAPAQQQQDDGDDRLFRTNIQQTTFG